MTKLKNWYRRNHTSVWALLLCLFASLLLSWSVRAEEPTPTISIPLTQWNELKANNAKALTLIKASKMPLTEVQSLTANQAKELTELKSINEQQFKELTKAKSDLQTQKDYLNETNKYLDTLKVDLKRNRATERRLERQRNTWAVVAGGILVAGILK